MFKQLLHMGLIFWQKVKKMYLSLLTLEVVLAGVAEVLDVAGQAALVADNEVRGGEISA